MDEVSKKIFKKTLPKMSKNELIKITEELLEARMDSDLLQNQRDAANIPAKSAAPSQSTALQNLPSAMTGAMPQADDGQVGEKILTSGKNEKGFFQKKFFRWTEKLRGENILNSLIAGAIITAATFLINFIFSNISAAAIANSISNSLFEPVANVLSAVPVGRIVFFVLEFAPVLLALTTNVLLIGLIIFRSKDSMKAERLALLRRIDELEKKRREDEERKRMERMGVALSLGREIARMQKNEGDK